MPLLDDALTRLDRADDAGAAAVLERLAAETPTHATVHVLRAQTCERLHRWDEALAAWQIARLFLPDLGIVHEGTLRAARVLAAIQTLRTPPRHAEPVPSTVAPLPADAPPATEPPLAPDPPRASAPSDRHVGFRSPVESAPPVPPDRWGAPERVREAAAPAPLPEWRPEPEMPRPAPEAGPASPSPIAPPLPPSAASVQRPSVFVDPFSSSPRARPWEAPAAPEAMPEPPASLPGSFAPPATSAEAPETFVAPPEAAFRPDAGPFAPAAEPGLPPAPLPSASPEAGADARLPGIPSTFDLDDLIESLSSAGRIVPRDDVDAVPPPPGLDADAADEVVSPTLARIFAAQGQTAEAIRAFERLAAAHPERAAEFRAEADALRAR